MPAAHAVFDKFLKDVRWRIKAPPALQKGPHKNHQDRWRAQTEAHPPVQGELGGCIDQHQLGEPLGEAVGKVDAEQPARRMSQQHHRLAEFESVQHGDQIFGDRIYRVAIARLVRQPVTPQVGRDAAVPLGEMLELVDPLESVPARSLDKEQHRARLTGPNVDDAETHIRLVLDLDSNSIVVEFAHRQGHSQLVGTIIRELAGICKRQSLYPGAVSEVAAKP